jgi:hypothetical protein
VSWTWAASCASFDATDSSRVVSAWSRVSALGTVRTMVSPSRVTSGFFKRKLREEPGLRYPFRSSSRARRNSPASGSRPRLVLAGGAVPLPSCPDGGPSVPRLVCFSFLPLFTGVRGREDRAVKRESVPLPLLTTTTPVMPHPLNGVRPGRGRSREGARARGCERRLRPTATPPAVPTPHGAGRGPEGSRGHLLRFGPAPLRPAHSWACGEDGPLGAGC